MKTKSAETTNTSTYVTVTLEEPIQRGNSTITELQLRRPKAGELRGMTLVDVAHLDVLALQKLLPRITVPTLTMQEVGNLELSDLMTMGSEVVNFLAKKADRHVSLNA